MPPPPFALIADCLSKLVMNQADLIFICLYWNSQPWFPVILRLATVIPILPPSSLDLLTSSLDETHPLCDRQSFRLTAWRLSGNVSKSEVFRNTLSKFSWREPATHPWLLTNQPGSIGVIGVLDGVKIPCRIACPYSLS